MIIIKRADRLQDGIVFNRKYRFKHPEVIIKTWYGLKIFAGKRWYRFYFKDKEMYNKLIFLLDLNDMEVKNENKAMG